MVRFCGLGILRLGVQVLVVQCLICRLKIIEVWLPGREVWVPGEKNSHDGFRFGEFEDGFISGKEY